MTLTAKNNHLKSLFEDIEILVVGDFIIDKHLWCETGRISPEAPVPICLQKSEETILGGAGNVSKQIGMINYGCMMTTMENKFNDKIECLLSENKIKKLHLGKINNFKTPKKTRVWSNGQQVCRIDQENILQPPHATYANWVNIITKIVESNISIKAVVFVDYDKGVLCDWMIEDIATFCKSYGVLIILDPKRPTFYNLKNLDIIKPNKKELESTGLPAEEVSQNMPNTYLVVTEGAKGITIYKNGKIVGSIPGKIVEVSDVCGAGDVVAATLALSMKDKELTDNNITNACKYSNLAASRVVQHAGNYSLSKEEFESIKGTIK